MKLRNKKTGKIGYLIVGKSSGYYTVCGEEWDLCGKYDSLAELNEEWEDYEEPKDKDFWFFDEEGTIRDTKEENWPEESVAAAKEIGNYFETKEEAEKAVEKLKVFKKLKDKGFKFIWVRTVGKVIDYEIPKVWEMPDNERKEIYEDLTFLFGDEV